MKLHGCLLLLLLNLITSSGCKKDDTFTNTNVEVILPLSVGNSWTYKVTPYDTGGNPLTYNLPDVGVQVYYDTLVGSDRWYSLSQHRPAVGFDWRSNKSDGLWQQDAYSRTYLLYKYPANANETYSSASAQVTVLAVDQMVTVPKGTYACIKYKFVDLGARATFYAYVSPNLGEIKFERIGNTPSGADYVYQTVELKSAVIR
jgi:hypothetical protein